MTKKRTKAKKRRKKLVSGITRFLSLDGERIVEVTKSKKTGR